MGSPASVITIGNFDGVHLGHAALIGRARELAAGGRRVVALAFDPHPAAVLAPGSEPARLTTFDRRAELLRAAGADEVVKLTPTADLLALEPRAFLDRVIDQHRAAAIVEGHDFHFGKARAGTPELLAAHAAARGVDASIVDEFMVELLDQTLVRASSTVVRWLISHGRVTDAARVLGRAYEVRGTVVRGDRRGRTIGFPTANLDPASLGGVMTPRAGVYGAWAELADARVFPAAVHIGPRATFGDGAPRIEAHLIGWSGPEAEGSPEYGWGLALRFAAYLRDPMKFDGVPALKDQIGRDCERAVALAGPGAPAPMRVMEGVV